MLRRALRERGNIRAQSFRAGAWRGGDSENSEGGGFWPREEEEGVQKEDRNG